jgi:tripartite ATP-independent transporter DctP family solute receptor
MYMKKFITQVLAVAMIATTLVGCGSSANTSNPAPSSTETTSTTADSTSAAPAPATDKKSYTFKYAELNPDGHIMDECADQFAELVKEKSDGRITIDVFPAGQLGDEKTVYQTLQMGGGAIDMCRGNTNSLTDFGVKKLSLFGLPFIFRDREHLWNVLNSEIGEAYLKEPQEIGTGMVGVFYLDEGSRNFFTTEKNPVSSIADFKGKKLRVPTTDLMSDTVAAMGVQSTPISFSELYSALQSGTVDGAEQPHSGYASNKLYEVAPNYILTGHTYSPSIILMSEASWNTLDAEDQAIVMEAAKETENWNKENIEKLDADLLQEIKDAGANVVEVPDKTPYIEAVKGVVEKYTAGLEAEYEAIMAK